MSARGAPRECINCRVAPRRRLTLANGCPLLQCPRCLLAWWPWEDFDPAGFYDRDYFCSPAADRGYDDYGALEAGGRRTARMRLRVIRDVRRAAGVGAAPGSLLDVGCATGVFLDEARRAGWRTTGIEVSRYAVEVARGRGLDVRQAPVEAAVPADARFDCVTLWDVIEHLRDPCGTTASLARLLPSGGVMALSTGDVSSLAARLSGARWHLFNLPEHLFFFSPRSLRALLGRAGLRVARLRREPSWCPVRYLTERVLKSARRRRPEADWGRLVLPVTLLDVVSVYATKPA